MDWRRLSDFLGEHSNFKEEYLSLNETSLYKILKEFNFSKSNFFSDSQNRKDNRSCLYPSYQIYNNPS